MHLSKRLKFTSAMQDEFIKFVALSKQTIAIQLQMQTSLSVLRSKMREAMSGESRRAMRMCERCIEVDNKISGNCFKQGHKLAALVHITNVCTLP